LVDKSPIAAHFDNDGPAAGEELLGIKLSLNIVLKLDEMTDNITIRWTE
jgi:hypothetical protein